MGNPIAEQLVKFQQSTGNPFTEATMQVFDAPKKHLPNGHFVPDSSSHGAWEPIRVLNEGETLTCAELIVRTNLSVSEFGQLCGFVRVAGV